MLRFPNCKINLGLYITRRRQDGFHDLETVFYPVPLHDALEVVPASNEGNLYLSGLAVSGNREENLVWRAYKLMQNQYPGRVPALDIYLQKNLPMGAGLGGGSADAAFTLQLINDYRKLDLSQHELARLALQLGSDCPFFIYNTPQFATGRGEDMLPVAVDLSAYSLQIICPKVHISTARAFGMITPAPAPFDLRELPSLPIDKWKDHVGNDFEKPIFSMHPVLQEIKDQLYQHGAHYASMSGSGSSIFAIFPKSQKAVIQTDIDIKSFYIA